MGLDQVGALTSACSLCGACGEVCPVRIPLPKLINRLRAEAVQADSAQPGGGALRRPGEAMLWQLWAQTYRSPRLYRLLRWAATRLRKLAPKKLGGWTEHRTAPQAAPHSLHELARRQGFSDE